MNRSFKTHWRGITMVIVWLFVCIWCYLDQKISWFPNRTNEEIPLLLRIAVYTFLTIDLAYILLIAYAGSNIEMFFLGWFATLLIILMSLFIADLTSHGLASRSQDAPTMAIAVSLSAFAITLANHVVAWALMLIAWLLGRMKNFVSIRLRIHQY